MGEGPIARIRRRRLRSLIAAGAAVALCGGAAIAATAASASSTTLASRLAAEYPGYHVPATQSASLYRDSSARTPIKHVVVIFDENDSFDHYFGTYPYAANTDGTPFTAKPFTPTVNGLYSKITKTGPAGPLLSSNPNEYNPQRLTHSESLTCDQNHGYLPEQEAVDGGLMDKFVQYTEQDSCSSTGEYYGPPGIVMDYYDGNTDTGLWNYAQNYAMSDNNWDTTFGPSTPGALNVVSGDTGYLGTAEFQHDLGAWCGQWQAATFIDSEHVVINKTPWVPGPNSANLSGAGLGLNWAGPYQFSARAYIAARFGGVSTVVPDSSSVRVWVELTKLF